MLCIYLIFELNFDILKNIIIFNIKINNFLNNILKKIKKF